MRRNQKTIIILTVGNEEQKNLSERLIAELYGPCCKDIIVVPDTENDCVRIGSGGAFLNIISKYYSAGDKLLVINSGGVSKRAVNYCVRGKAFAQFLPGGSCVSLLEQIIKNARKLLKKTSSGVLVCCSDILVNTGDYLVSGEENVGFAVRGDCFLGEKHGVFFCRGDKAFRYMHKKSRIDFEKVDPDCNENGVLLDTGMVFFNDGTVMALKNSCEKNHWLSVLKSSPAELNLYPEIVSLLNADKNIFEYLHADSPPDEIIRIREDLIEALDKTEMKVFFAGNEKFRHFGTMKESLENILAFSSKKGQSVFINSYSDNLSTVSQNTVLDNVSLHNCKIGSNCLISDILLDDAVVEDNLSVCGIKLKDGSSVTVVCSIDENPKDLLSGVELWKRPRFYKGRSFTSSYSKFLKCANEERFSLEYCVTNADYGYYFDLRKYLADMNGYTVNPAYLDFRKKIIENSKKTFKPKKQLRCLYNKVEISLPVRVNFSGTWTDAMPYCIENGGQVVNMAVTVDGKLPIKVVVERFVNSDNIEFCCDGKSTDFSFGDAAEDDFSDYALHKAALHAVGVNAETQIQNGFRISTSVVGIDKGSGLGVSSILLSGCIKAMCLMFGFEYTDSQILEAVFAAEQIMGTGGGWQDQAGGFFPGIKCSSSKPGVAQKLFVEKIDMTAAFCEFISKRFFLVPTGKRHYGRFIVNDVVNRYLEKNPDSLCGHREIRSLNEKIIESIQNSDFSQFSSCINRHFELLKLISPEVSDPDIDELSQRLLKIADSVCALGAGGGGYLLVVAKENVSRKKIESFMKGEFPHIKSGIKQIDVFDSKLQIRCE